VHSRDIAAFSAHGDDRQWSRCRPAIRIKAETCQVNTSRN
jgi:hypothetical protein